LLIDSSDLVLPPILTARFGVCLYLQQPTSRRSNLDTNSLTPIWKNSPVTVEQQEVRQRLVSPSWFPFSLHKSLCSIYVLQLCLMC
jgi:hypothetical protein